MSTSADVLNEREPNNGSTCARQHDGALPALLWHDTAKKRFRVICATT